MCVSVRHWCDDPQGAVCGGRTHACEVNISYEHRGNGVCTEQLVGRSKGDCVPEASCDENALKRSHPGLVLQLSFCKSRLHLITCVRIRPICMQIREFPLCAQSMLISLPATHVDGVSVGTEPSTEPTAVIPLPT
ncbi:unnamed protein product [Pleuronectes platessa]|uniref:Uncharacterized protein n=1 Tax=Pleuronectes platessa TaxID=8262 RepID=A0A9N7TPL3_PLEPL|nr:unnamed protein product [Pleuronectes platessa]